MNSRAFISVFVTASILLFPGVTFAKTASCPCSPCKCSPCTCGGGGSKSSGGKHHDRHGHDHGSSFGVGGTVDLGGIGHRTSEPNPFGVGGGEKPVAHTEEKRTTKRKVQLKARDSKQLVDDWKTKFENALKSGASVEDNGLVPPAKNDIEKKKYAVITAQNHLNKAKSFYDWKKQSAANQDEEVKKAQDALSNWGATSTNDPKYKAAVADFDKTI